MIKLSRILCATDFSEYSLAALPYAKSFAKEYGAELHCLHIVDEAYQYWMAMNGEGLPMGPSPQEMIRIAEQQMVDFAEKHLADCGSPVVTKVGFGRPFVEIIEYAREISADLIVIATHGRSGLKQALLGGTTEKVIRKAPCPVLSIRRPGHEFVMP
jgi:nucleotide-binding universal stress UspA family protein